MSKLTALITGASSGIGYELAKIHAQHHYDLVIVARNKNKLEKVKKELESTYGNTVYVFSVDLAEPQNITALNEFIDDQHLRIDHLINNAGIGVFGKFWKTSLDENLKLIQLNINTLVALTHHYSKKMAKRGGGKILNVSSTAAFMPGPYMSTYFASKAFVLSFGEAVHSELQGTGVTVTTLCPGPTETGFEAAATGMAESGLFTKSKVATPYKVAKDGFDSMMKGKPVIISGAINKLNAFSIRFSPRSLVTSITKKIMQPVD